MSLCPRLGLALAIIGQNLRNCRSLASHCVIPPGDNSCSFYPREVALLPPPPLSRGYWAFFMLPLFVCVTSPTTGCLVIPKYRSFGHCSANPMRDLATDKKTEVVWNIFRTRWTKDHPQPLAYLLGHQSHPFKLKLKPLQKQCGFEH